MNKYLQLIKSGKQPRDAGSKGSEGPFVPFEPARGDHNQQIARTSIHAVHASEPFEPAPDRHIEKLNCSNRTLAGSNTSQLKTVEHTGSIGSKGSEGPCEPFEPIPGSCIEKNAPRDALACDGALYADGPYLPWGPYVNREQLATMQRDLLTAVEELARLESWPDDYFDHVAYCIERQPTSTLRTDLAYFTERIRVVRAEEAARLAVGRRSWRYDR